MVSGPSKVEAAKSALFWDIMQRILINHVHVSGQIVGPILKVKEVFLEFLKLEDWTDRLSGNFDRELPLYAA